MSPRNLEQKALSLLAAFEHAGRTVTKVVIDGKKIELELAICDASDDFDKIDMRHGKT